MISSLAVLVPTEGIVSGRSYSSAKDFLTSASWCCSHASIRCCSYRCYRLICLITKTLGQAWVSTGCSHHEYRFSRHLYQQLFNSFIHIKKSLAAELITTQLAPSHLSALVIKFFNKNTCTNHFNRYNDNHSHSMIQME